MSRRYADPEALQVRQDLLEEDRRLSDLVLDTQRIVSRIAEQAYGQLRALPGEGKTYLNPWGDHILNWNWQTQEHTPPIPQETAFPDEDTYFIGTITASRRRDVLPIR
jgi:hypothetical protein